MPELPEVETFKRFLDKSSLRQLITGVKVNDERVLDVDYSYLGECVVNKQFISTTRHGKYLLVWLKPKYLVIHFGMTGDLQYYNIKFDEPKFSKVIFHFRNKFSLAYKSTRMFGRLYIADSIEEFIKMKKLGPDAYTMSFEEFIEALKRRSAIVKNALLNQSFIAGIGNIYSDEILFSSKLNPKKKLDSLNDNQKKELFSSIKKVLKFGIEKKGDLSTYPDNFLIPHRMKDGKCPRCNNGIERYDISGRRGWFCPNCQN
jgi:formamidopyrimidine-DNA glycosylase